MPSALEKSALNRAEQESRKQKKPAGCALWAWQGLPKHSHPLVSHGPPSTDGARELEMPRGGSRGLTPAQLDRHSSAGQGLATSMSNPSFTCQAHPAKVRCSLQQRWRAEFHCGVRESCPGNPPLWGYVYAPNSWKSSKRKIHPAPLWPRRPSLDSPTRPDASSTDTNKSTVSGLALPSSTSSTRPVCRRSNLFSMLFSSLSQIPPPAGSTLPSAPSHVPFPAAPALLLLPEEQLQLRPCSSSPGVASTK